MSKILGNKAKWKSNRWGNGKTYYYLLMDNGLELDSDMVASIPSVRFVTITWLEVSEDYGIRICIGDPLFPPIDAEILTIQEFASRFGKGNLNNFV